MKINLLLLVLLWPLCLPAQPAVALQWEKQRLAPGLQWWRAQPENWRGSRQSINLFRVNTGKRELSVAVAHDTLLPTSQLGDARGALAAVNAGFFKIKEGRGAASYLKVDGETIAALPSREPPVIDGALLIGVSGRLKVEHAQPPEAYEQDEAFFTVLSSGPVLLLDGAPRPLADNPFNKNRHPRTCLCLLNRRKALLITVDGRNGQAAGMSLSELAGLLRELGCRDAINLDGGGSTSMWINGMPDNGIVNYPSDNKRFDHEGERPVANAIIIK